MTGEATGNRTKSRFGTRGALVLIASLMIGSALVRLGDAIGQAAALETKDASKEAPEISLGPSQAPSREELSHLLTAFQTREARITEQEEAIRTRMQALRIAEQEVDRKLAALSEAERALRETIALAESASDEDLTRLTRVYETMKPKQAAALFEEMTPDFAAGFLARMRPEAAAAIMAGLSPAAAHSFSVVLAGRNADVPKDE